MFNYLLVTVKTPICSTGVTVTPARGGLAGGEEWPKDEISVFSETLETFCST